MKKIMVAFLVCMLLIAGTVYADDVTEFINDGSIHLNGQVSAGHKGDVITVNVLKSSFDWDDEDTWKNENPVTEAGNIKYYDVIVLESNGMWDIDFYLDEMGEYTAYIGSELLDEPDVIKFVYTNETAMQDAADDLVSATSVSEVKGYLTNNRFALRLYSPKYNNVNLDNVATLVYDYINGNSAVASATEKEITDIIYMGFMSELLRTNSITDLNDVKELLGLDTNVYGDYYRDDFGISGAARLSLAQTDTIANYKDAMFYTMFGLIAEQSDGKAGVKAMLEEYKKNSNLNFTVSDSLCNAIVGNSVYSETVLRSYISAYGSVVTPQNPPSGGGGGGGGGAYNTGNHQAADSNTSGLGFTTEPDKKNELETYAFIDIENYTWAQEAIDALYKKGVISGRGDGLFCPEDFVLREEFVKMLVKACKLNVVGGVPGFKDVLESEWYYDSVNCAYNAGIIRGFSDETFGIGYNITREDICVIVYNAIQVCDAATDVQITENSFSDKNVISDYAIDAVNYLTSAGIINGNDDGSFKPKNSATRAEAAKIIYAVSLLVDRV